MCGSGHWRLEHPKASQAVIVPASSSDHRWHLNALANMRRALPPEPKPGRTAKRVKRRPAPPKPRPVLCSSCRRRYRCRYRLGELQAVRRTGARRGAGYGKPRSLIREVDIFACSGHACRCPTEAVRKRSKWRKSRHLRLSLRLRVTSNRHPELCPTRGIELTDGRRRYCSDACKPGRNGVRLEAAAGSHRAADTRAGLRERLVGRVAEAATDAMGYLARL